MKHWVTKNNYEIFLILSERSNVYFVRKESFSMLVDTGAFYERRKIVKKLEKLGVNKIDYLLLTHTHFDHVQNAAFLKQKFQARIIVHTSEADFLTNGYSPLPQGTIFPTKLLINTLNFFHFRARHQPCDAEIKITSERFYLPQWDSDTFILHTPGHTKGSVSFIIDKEIAIVGDSMMGTYHNSISVPFADDTSQVAESWMKLLDTNCSLFLPGHGTANERKLVKKCTIKKLY